MKKIYLLLLLALLSSSTFATTYYSRISGDVTVRTNWQSAGFPAGNFLGLVDTFIFDLPMTITSGETWTVRGTVGFRFGNLTVIGTGPLATINVGNSFFMAATASNNTVTSNTNAANLVLNVNGDVIITGAGDFTPQGSSSVQFNFVNAYDSHGTNNTFAIPEHITWNSTGHSYKTSLAFNNISALLSDIPLPDTTSAGEVLNDTLICGIYSLRPPVATPTIDPISFTIANGAGIYMANAGGIDSTIKYCVNSFSQIAHYTYNGTVLQKTGTSLPPFIDVYGPNVGSVTVDNPAGVTLTNNTDFFDGAELDLELGTLDNSGNNVFIGPGSFVKVDTGTFSTSPGYSGGVHLWYTNLGYNAPRITTGLEVGTQVAFLEIRKPLDTVVFGSWVYVDSELDIRQGTLDEEAQVINMYNGSSFNNFSGNGAFMCGTGRVNFVGSSTNYSAIFGTYPTTFNQVTLSNAAGLYISTSDTILNSLQLANGNFTIGNNDLVFGPSALATPASPFSNTNMIVASGTGHVQTQMATDRGYLLPIGDTLNYSPITLLFSGSAAYAAGAYTNVNVHPYKEPHNADTANYLDRYWTVTTDSITTPSYTAIYSYVPTDVVGTEALISGAAYIGSLPFQLFSITNAALHTITTNVVNDTMANFTGIDGVPPTVVASDDTTICVGGFDTVSVLRTTGDTPFVYTWAPATGLSATTGTVVVATPTVTTTYTVTLTNSNGITATDTVRITVNGAPSLDSARNSGPICSGNTLFFTPYNPQNVTGYMWSGPVAVTNSTLATASIPGAYTTATGIYTVTVNDGIGNGCTMTYYDTATVDTFPNAVTVLGAGVYCDTANIYAHITSADVIYFQGTTSGGTSTADADSVIHLTDTGTHTYYFRALSALGCWGAEGSAVITINPLPLPDTALGGGEFCDSTVLTSTSGDSGTVYFQGTTSGGTSTTMGGSPHTVAASGTYYFRSISSHGCWGAEASVTVTIDASPTPVVVDPLADGTFCGSDTINVTGGTGGTIYFEGTTSAGTDISDPTVPQVVTTSGTYYFRAESVSPTGLGCWSKQDSAAVNINALPATVTITANGGTGPDFCDSVTLFADNGGDQVIYFEGTTSNGTSTAVPATSMFVNGLGDSFYHFRAHNTLTGCWSADDSIEINIHNLPAPVTATGGGGPFCGSRQISGDDGEDAIGTIVFFQGTTRGGTDGDAGNIATTTNPYTVTTSGTYTYYLRAVTTAGCWSTEGISDDSVTVTINPLPAIHNVTGGGSYCAGGAGFNIGLDASDTGISYQLFNQTDTVGGIFAGTLSSLDFGMVTAGGTYTVIAIDTTTLCTDTTSAAADFALINVNPVPDVHTLSIVSGTGAYCLHGTGIDIQLDNSQPYINYQINDNGVTENTIAGDGSSPFDLGMYTDTGIYKVIAITDSNCMSTMLDSVHITTLPLPDLHTVTGGGTLCYGDTGYHVFLGVPDLTHTQAGISYQLFNGTNPIGFPQTGTGASLDLGLQSIAGDYIVIATNPTTSCTDTMTGTAIVVVNPLPLEQYVSVAGGTAANYCNGTGGLPVSVATSESGLSYQLYYNGTIDGPAIIATGSEIDFPAQTLAGNYSVIATNPSTSCKSYMEDSVTIAINVLPTVYTVFGGGNYCVGGTGYNIGLSGTQSSFEYVLNLGGSPVDSVVGTGLVDSFGHQTAAGTYTITSRNTSTECMSNMAGTATIFINALPTIYTVDGGGPFCAGAPGVPVSLSNSTTGINYQLSRDGATIGGVVAGVGTVLNFGIENVAGRYTVMATNPVTGCINAMADTAVVTVNPLPTVYDITGGGSYCAGGAGVALGLDSSATGIKYKLYFGTVSVDSLLGTTGSPINFGLFTAAGTYTVKAINATTGCTDSMTGSRTIAINALPASNLVTGGGTYCLGGAGVDVDLTVSDLGYLYLLYDGTSTVGGPRAGTGSLLDFGPQTLAGTYTVIGIDTATTCLDTMTGSAVITVQSPLIPVVAIVAYPSLNIGVGSNDTLVAITTGGGTDVTYQWYVNGNLVAGATNDTFAFTVYYNTDSITCQATSHGTCGGYMTSQSAFISLHNVGVQQVIAVGSDIKLVPNPNKGIFTLKGTLGTTNDQEVTIEISDMLGQTIYKQNVTATGGNVNEKIQLSSSLANGMYILNLRSGSQSNIFHFVIEQ